MEEPDPYGKPVRRFVDPAYRPLCASLAEVRANIDRIDRSIVGLLAERAGYVKDATRFKLDPFQVAAPARQAEVFAKVRALALAAGAPPDIVDATYRALVAGFIAHEQTYLGATEPIEPTGRE